MVTLNPMFVGLWGPYPITMVFTISTKSSLELHFQVQGEAPRSFAKLGYSYILSTIYGSCDLFRFNIGLKQSLPIVIKKNDLTIEHIV